jgi:hypothetical protein
MARKPSSRRVLASAKRKALEAAGWKIGDAADFLQTNDQERQFLADRVELASLAAQRRRGNRSKKPGA